MIQPANVRRAEEFAMSFDPLDPKWSAFVLGELDDEARAQIDRELAESPDAQRFVDELRRTIDLVSAELRAEPCPVMADAERAVGDASDGELADGALAPAATTDDEPGSRSRLFRTVRPEGHSRTVGRLAVIGLAASLLAMVGLGSYLLFPGSWHIRDLKLAWKTDRHTDARVAESPPSDGRIRIRSPTS
jgi:anti-sigma factor RsiW